MTDEPSNFLDMLDAVLQSAHVNADAMTLSELDGFLAGMILSPAAVPPAEWMRQVWGKAGLNVESVEQQEAINNLVMTRYRQVVNRLDKDIYSPIYEAGVDGQLNWSIWAGGFIRAMALRPDGWHRIETLEAQDDGVEAQQVVFTFMRLFEQAVLPEDERDASFEMDSEMFAVAPDLIPEGVRILFAAKRAAGAVIPMKLEDVELKVGRNDPCLCGSGKKYKKCCMARDQRTSE